MSAELGLGAGVSSGMLKVGLREPFPGGDLGRVGLDPRLGPSRGPTGLEDGIDPADGGSAVKFSIGKLT